MCASCDAKLRVVVCQGPAALRALIVIRDISPTPRVKHSAKSAPLDAMLAKLGASTATPAGLGKHLGAMP